MESKVTVPGYIEYFRNLSVRHVDIAHDPASEDNDGDPGKKKFTRWSADEAVTSLRTKIGWPGCLLEMFEVTTQAAVPYDVKGFYTGAFTILDHAKPGDTKSEVDALTTCEIIYKEYLQHLYQDHYGKNKDRCETPFAEFSFNNIQITPVGPLFENEFGFRIEFQFKPKNLLKIMEPPAEGRFL